MSTSTVLVVEDEASFVEALQIGLGREGFDVHVATAERMFAVDMAALAVADPDRWAVLRARAKTINFGIVYGQGAAALGRSLTLAGSATTTSEAEVLLGALDLFRRHAHHAALVEGVGAGGEALDGRLGRLEGLRQAVEHQERPDLQILVTHQRLARNGYLIAHQQLRRPHAVQRFVPLLDHRDAARCSDGYAVFARRRQIGVAILRQPVLLP